MCWVIINYATVTFQTYYKQVMQLLEANTEDLQLKMSLKATYSKITFFYKILLKLTTNDTQDPTKYITELSW